LALEVLTRIDAGQFFWLRWILGGAGENGV
jgi:hypothetical protein